MTLPFSEDGASAVAISAKRRTRPAVWMQKIIVLTGRLRMEKKQKFKVYLVGKGHGCYASEYWREELGETWATSKEKAISNIRYRLRQKGELLPDDLGDSEGRGYVTWVFEAVTV